MSKFSYLEVLYSQENSTMNNIYLQNNFYTPKQNISFKGYEKTFMMIKPDAFYRNLDKLIEKNITASGLKISESFEGIAPRSKMENNYINKKNKSFFKEWMDFLTSGKIKALVVEGDNAISRALNLKKEIRNQYAPNEKRFNLIHCSDDIPNAKREIKNFFDKEV